MFMYHQHTHSGGAHVLFTCSYPQLAPVLQARPGLLPVRTSRGFPRYKLKYELQAYHPLITPGPWFKEAAETYVPKYLDQLDGHGVKKIQDVTKRLLDQHQATDAVFLCFEDLGNPANWCHRRLFAQWWLEHTGEEVDELGRMYVPPAEPDEDLFSALDDGA
jgi:hypothetical protein